MFIEREVSNTLVRCVQLALSGFQLLTGGEIAERFALQVGFKLSNPCLLRGDDCVGKQPRKLLSSPDASGKSLFGSLLAARVFCFLESAARTRFGRNSDRCSLMLADIRCVIRLTSPTD